MYITRYNTSSFIAAYTRNIYGCLEQQSGIDLYLSGVTYSVKSTK